MGGSATPTHDPVTDRAAALLRELDTHKTDEAQPAQPMERVGARIVDLVVWSLLGAAWSLIGFYVDRWVFEDPLRVSVDPQFGYANTYRPDELNPLVAWGTFIGLLVSIYVYEVVPTARSGAHFAKRRFKLTVRGPDGGSPGFGRASLRFAAWWLPLFLATSFWGATFGSQWGFLAIALQAGALAIPGWMFRDEDHRGLHDRLAGTTVVAER